MKKTKHEPTPAATRSAVDRETNGHASAQENTANSTPAQDTTSADVRGEATRWVQENQTLALVGAFGVGVFLGVLLRK